MKKKVSPAHSAPSRKLHSQIATVQKQADAAKKEAKLAKLDFRNAKQIYKNARRSARKLRKEVKMLKAKLAALAAKKPRAKTSHSVIGTKSAKRLRPVPTPVTSTAQFDAPTAPVESAAPPDTNPPIAPTI